MVRIRQLESISNGQDLFKISVSNMLCFCEKTNKQSGPNYIGWLENFLEINSQGIAIKHLKVVMTININ